ncbi:MAG: SBBP repeat-containing protein [Pyrinomonadaceae bacterium]
MKLKKWSLAFLIFPVIVFGSLMVLRDPAGSERQTARQLPTKKDLSIEAKKAISENFGKIPLHFEKNEDPASDLRFISRDGRHALFLKQNEARLVLPNDGGKKADVLKMRLAGRANQDSSVEGLDQLPGKTNYFTGSDPDKWRTGVPTYAKVRYADVYDGVDLIYYGDRRRLEYDFVVAPNVDPGIIKLNFENAEKIEMDKNGDLLLRVGSHTVRQHAPFTYQEIDGVRKEIRSAYVIGKKGSKSANEVAFRLGDYDKSRPVVIDPVIVFSTLLGGSSGDDFFNIEAGFSIKVDSDGNIYLAGETPSGDFPVQNPHQPTTSGNFDGFITKFNPTGSALIYSTYFGGTGEDRVSSLSVGPANQVFVSGFTMSTDFPTMTPFQPSNAGSTDGFIARFDANGSLNYSTYFGGTSNESCTFSRNEGSDVVAFAGSTNSSNLPTANPLQPNNAGNGDFFAGKLNIATNSLIFSTYLGGSASDNMNFSSGALDSAGNLYVAGVSSSFDYPTTPNAYQVESNGSDEVVITKISPTGGSLVYSTFIGGNLIDSADALAVDTNGNAYVTGFTRSANYPLKNAVLTELRDVDSFVTKLNPDGSALVYSTFLGGHNLERGSGITTDEAGNCYVTGRSNSGDFPAKRAVRSPRGLDDVFISKFNRDGALIFSTLIGGGGNDYGFGIAADNANNVYVTGRATVSFFTTGGAFQRSLGGGADAFVAKVNTSIRKVKSDFDGDGKSDLAVFRPSEGVWYVAQSSDGAISMRHFGTNGDIPVPGDYDGDGKTDLAVYRPSEGVWYIQDSGTSAVRSLYWGVDTDVPVQADYDGDDKTDVAVYRPSSGVWYMILSSTNGLRTNILGSDSDRPVPADYDGDGIMDIGIYRPLSGVWLYVGSSKGVNGLQFGVETDRPVPADYDGDGYDDISVYRPSEGLWYRLQSGSGNSLFVYQWGLSQDIPVAADYDGDGKEDIAIFRPSDGNWYVTRSSNDSFFSAPFGSGGDIPVASAYVP